MASSSTQTSSNSVTYSMDPSSFQTPSSNSVSTSPDPTVWDVFLSFYGKDTRYNFTSHLYDKLVSCGIRTYMDNPELGTGEVITNALIRAIRDSKIYIVVFSTNYAFSPWCLDELVEIYECHKTMNRLIVGVYCNIDPMVVRHQTGKYKDAFDKHETGRFVGDKEKVDTWRDTLTNVAGFSGKHIPAERSEADIINEIVEKIVSEINPKTLQIAKYPIGLDSHLKCITTLLSSGTAECGIKFGIYGMAGVGKTTLAKALYNRLLLESFNGICFLANVGDVCGRPNGLESLQQQFIDDILKRKNIFKVNNVDEGINFIRDRFHSKKVLLVIDDLDQHTQFDFLVSPFAPGSVVIITTKNEGLLHTIEVETKYHYMVNGLDDKNSLILFSQHAFGKLKPNETLNDLSKDIIRHAGGLPLALEVFGSSLYKRSEVAWKSFIEKLQRIPNSTIHKRLNVSLDALESDDPMLKQLFLDIACFFIGREKKEVVKVMESYYSYADYNIDILKERCLLTINDCDELGMHDLLRDIGRYIGRNNYPDEPGKHSRLYVSKDIHEVLKKHKGTEAVQCIIPSNFYDWEWNALEEVSLAAETFKRMRKLRFLYLKNTANITGSLEDAFENLRWLCWKYCPWKWLPSEFCPQKLVILDLPHSNLRTMWKLNMGSHVFDNLKTLNMSESLDLTLTPDFTKIPCLETLKLKGCVSLEEVHISIGSLVRVVSIDLYGCVKLKSLPDTICNLRSLENLRITRCSGLKALPIQLGKLESLKVLNAFSIGVSNLPDSIGCLGKLVVLRLGYSSKLKSLPETICRLRQLKTIDIQQCSNLEALPIELGNIESLKYLDASMLTILTIPDSIGRLSKLVRLDISYNYNLETLPDSICSLRALEYLRINNCIRLKDLPVELGNIQSLKELNAMNLPILNIPDSIGRLSNLVKLTLRNNKNLKTLPDTICNLRALHSLIITDCSSLKALPIDMGNMISLSEIEARFLDVSKLPDSIGRLSNLFRLDLSYNKNLETLPDTISKLTSLRSLRLDNCKKLEELPDQIHMLSNLVNLDLSRCRRLLSISELPPNLTCIKATGCESLQRLPNLSNLKQLEDLDLTYNSGLTEILGLETLTCIETLQLEGCNSSLVATTLTKHLFQVFSTFRREIHIYIPEFPDWIGQSPYWISRLSDRSSQSPDVISDSSERSLQLISDVTYNLDSEYSKNQNIEPSEYPCDMESSELESTMSFKLPQNMTHDFIAIILCYKRMAASAFGRTTYSIRNTSSCFTWSSSFYIKEAQLIILPSSLFSVTDGDRIEFTTEESNIVGIHLLYKTEIAMHDKYNNTTVDDTQAERI